MGVLCRPVGAQSSPGNIHFRLSFAASKSGRFHLAHCVSQLSEHTRRVIYIQLNSRYCLLSTVVAPMAFVSIQTRLFAWQARTPTTSCPSSYIIPRTCIRCTRLHYHVVYICICMYAPRMNLFLKPYTFPPGIISIYIFHGDNNNSNKWRTAVLDSRVIVFWSSHTLSREPIEKKSINSIGIIRRIIRNRQKLIAWTCSDFSRSGTVLILRDGCLMSWLTVENRQCSRSDGRSSTPKLTQVPMDER